MTTQSSNPLQIVVGLELDETGKVAFESASALARATGAQLHLCFCAGPVDEGVTAAERRLEHGRHALSRWATTHLRGDPLLDRIRLYVDLGRPADVLRRLAADTRAAMIVVGSHGKGPLARLTQGSVVHDLMQKSPCPVTVATDYDHAAFEALPAIEAAPSPNQADPTIEHPHRYHYRRSVRMNASQPTVGAGAAPMSP
jgi:nucleotide-binding universal stress UspA family protein